jgi:outer membrane lipopolysaccharide assembly protein LptE/RlpB
MKNSHIKIHSLIIALTFLVSAQSFAIGLGEPDAPVRWGDPLNVLIPILGSSILGDVRASRIGVNECTRTMGACDELSPYRFTTKVIERDGQLFVNLSSPAPVLEVYLTLAVHAEDKNGEVNKIITLLPEMVLDDVRSPVADAPNVGVPAQAKNAETAPTSASATHTVVLRKNVDQKKVKIQRQTKLKRDGLLQISSGKNHDQLVDDIAALEKTIKDNEFRIKDVDARIAESTAEVKQLTSMIKELRDANKNQEKILAAQAEAHKVHVDEIDSRMWWLMGGLYGLVVLMFSSVLIFFSRKNRGY